MSHLFDHEICDRLRLNLVYKLRERFNDGIISAAERDAENRSPVADYSAVKRVLNFSDEDLHLEEFFALIPGFKSKVAKDTQKLFKDGIVSGSLLEWMNRTLSSTTLPDEVKQRSVALCRKVMDIASLPVNSRPLCLGLYYWEQFFCSIDSALILQAATYHDDPEAL